MIVKNGKNETDEQKVEQGNDLVYYKKMNRNTEILEGSKKTPTIVLDAGNPRCHGSLTGAT